MDFFLIMGTMRTFCTFEIPFQDFRPLLLWTQRERGEQTAEMAKESAISERVYFCRDAGNNDGG